jgi:tape measure domain-containing protein
LFDTTSFKTAAAIASVVGVGAALTVASVMAIKATMDMQKFEATLTASTGSAALAGDEYKRVAAIANEWGFNVRDMVEPYAKFTTAARLSGLALDDQVRAFEAVTVSSRAMHLNTERTSLVFLAFEQMLSKGTVSMEELRRQLGDLLPGAFAIAAKSMGMTQAAFSKAITDGDIMAKDLIPRLSSALLTIFGPAAEKASHNLQAEMERFKTSLFNVEIAFDRTTNITKIFTDFVVGATGAMNAFARNMDTAFAVMGALGGAAGMMLVIANLARIKSGVETLIISMMVLKDALTGVGFASVAAAGAGMVGILIRIAAVVAAAAAGFALFKPAVKDATDGIQDWIDKANEWINIQNKIGVSDKLSTQLMTEGAATRYRAITAEVMRTKSAIEEKLKVLEDARAKERQGSEGLARNRVAQSPDPADDPDVKAMREKLVELLKLHQDLEDKLRQFEGMPTETADNTKPITTQWEHFVQHIGKDIRELDMLKDQLKAADLGKEAMQQAEAMKKALDFLAAAPLKERGQPQTINALEKAMLDLAKKGFFVAGEGADMMAAATDSLTKSLAALYLQTMKDQALVKEIEGRPAKYAAATETYTKMMEELQARSIAATSNPGELTNNKQLEEHIARINNLFRSIQGFDEGKLQKLKDDFRELWNTTMRAEDGAKEINKLRNEIDALENTLGSRTERTIEHLADQVDTISRSYAAGIRTYEQSMASLEMANNRAYQVLLSNTNKFGQETQHVLKGIDSELTKALVDPLFGVQNAWEHFFKNIGRLIAEFIMKMTVVQPLMTGLFGAAYSGQASSGQGAFGGMLSKMGIPAFSWMGLNQDTLNIKDIQAQYEANNSPNSAAPNDFGAEPDWMSLFPGTGFASGGSFKVGGSGGTDSQPVAFWASPDETVTVSTPDNMAKKAGGVRDLYIIDAKGADQSAIDRLEKKLLAVNASVERRAIKAVEDFKRR